MTQVRGFAIFRKTQWMFRRAPNWSLKRSKENKTPVSLKGKQVTDHEIEIRA